MIPKEIEKKFTVFITKDSKIQRAKDLAEWVTEGELFLTGGYAFSKLVELVYGSAGLDKKPRDIDLLCERVKEEYSAPRGWRSNKNPWGNLTFSKDGLDVDFILRRNLHPFANRVDMPTIEDFLRQTPLTIQSIAYDIYAQRFVGGEVCWQAILQRTVAVNNLSEADFLAKMSRLTPEKLIKQKARSLGFQAVI